MGIKPTLGLVPGFGIAPIDVSQDTAGPMEKTVTDAALTLQSLAGSPEPSESDEEYEGMEGPNYLENGDISGAVHESAQLLRSAHDELRQRQEHRLQQHHVHDRPAGDHVHAESDQEATRKRSRRWKRRARSWCRRTDDCGQNPQSAERL